MVTLLPVKTMTEYSYKTGGKVALVAAATAFSFFSISKAISAYSNHCTFSWELLNKKHKDSLDQYNKSALNEAYHYLDVYTHNFLAIPIKEDEDSLCKFFNELFDIEDEWELLDEKHEESVDHDTLSTIINDFNQELELFCSAKNKLTARIESHRGKEKFIEFCREGDSVIGDLNDSITKLIDLKNFISRYEIFFETKMLLRDLSRRYKRHSSLCFSDPLAYACMHYKDSLFPYSKLKEQLDNDWIKLSKYAYDSSLNSSWSVVQEAQAYSKSLQAVSEVISRSQEYLLEKQKEKEVPLIA
jgi:hypothetical protein